jgi:hypothetical protein
MPTGPAPESSAFHFVPGGGGGGGPDFIIRIPFAAAAQISAFHLQFMSIMFSGVSR